MKNIAKMTVESTFHFIELQLSKQISKRVRFVFAFKTSQNDIFKSRYSDKVPLARMADKSEIASALMFLVSDESTYINGQNLTVDGGFSIW